MPDMSIPTGVGNADFAKKIPQPQCRKIASVVKLSSVVFALLLPFPNQSPNNMNSPRNPIADDEKVEGLNRKEKKSNTRLGITGNIKTQIEICPADIAADDRQVFQSISKSHRCSVHH